MVSEINILQPGNVVERLDGQFRWKVIRVHPTEFDCEILIIGPSLAIFAYGTKVGDVRTFNLPSAIEALQSGVLRFVSAPPLAPAAVVLSPAPLQCSGPCRDFFPMAQPNQPDGKRLVCWSCRSHGFRLPC